MAAARTGPGVPTVHAMTTIGQPSRRLASTVSVPTNRSTLMEWLGLGALLSVLFVALPLMLVALQTT